MAGNKKKTSGGGDWGWPLIILAFCFGLWPIGLRCCSASSSPTTRKSPFRRPRPSRARRDRPPSFLGP